MDPVHVILVLDDGSGHEAIYVGGELVYQGDTIYSGDIAKAVEGKTISLSQVVVDMPADVHEYPEHFDECISWVPVSDGDD